MIYPAVIIRGQKREVTQNVEWLREVASKEDGETRDAYIAFFEESGLAMS